MLQLFQSPLVMLPYHVIKRQADIPRNWIAAKIRAKTPDHIGLVALRNKFKFRFAGGLTIEFHGRHDLAGGL